MSVDNYSPEDIESLQKDRPANESEKRFVLSPEEFAKGRIEAIKDEISEIKEKYPEALSFCMFGSMVKGTVHEESDIDGFLYVDSELAAQREGIPEEDILEQELGDSQMYFTREVAGKYAGEFREGVKEKSGLDAEAVKDIRSRPISEKVINREIETMIDYYKRRESYETDMNRWEESEPPRGSELEVLIAYQESKPKRPEHMSASLGSMFHLDVGGGIRKYRNLFIEKLSQLGEEGERLWEDTIKGTEMLENNFSLDETKRYPHSLEEASKLYGAERDTSKE